jgi:hypothetical protein
MTGLRQALADAFAHGAFPPGTDPKKVVNSKQGVRSLAAGAGNLFSAGEPISMRLLIQEIESIPPYKSTPTSSPAQSSPHIQLSFTSTDITVSGTGFLANLEGIGANAVHLRVVDGNNPANNTVLPYRSDSSGNFSADLLLSDAAFAGLTVNAFGQTVVAFSAYDNRIDPTSVPAGGPLTSNTVRVTNILSANRQVVST